MDLSLYKAINGLVYVTHKFPQILLKFEMENTDFHSSAPSLTHVKRGDS
jgi:hypothetical protein